MLKGMDTIVQPHRSWEIKIFIPNVHSIQRVYEMNNVSSLPKCVILLQNNLANHSILAACTAGIAIRWQAYFESPRSTRSNWNLTVSHVHILLQTWCLFFLISPLDHRERGTLLFPTNLSFFCLHLQHMAPNSVTQCLGVVVTCEMNVGANLFYKPGGMTTWSIPWTATFPGTVYKSGSTTLAAEFTPMKMPWDE